MKNLTNNIVEWILNYSNENKINDLVVGVSGGIDSAVVSTLCCMTKLNTHLINIPIHQNENQIKLAHSHIIDLKRNYKNVIDYNMDLTNTYNNFNLDINLPESTSLSLANTKSRLRMVTLYHVASNVNGLVVGTGNKIEDFGIGFFTKYGDGGVDISPIADLTKTQVRELAKYLNIIYDIQIAKPTDGLWNDDRTDEDQIKCTYEELEWSMKYIEENSKVSIAMMPNLSERECFVLNRYLYLYNVNKHKFKSIPVYKQ